MRLLQPDTAPHTHTWTSVVWGYWCSGCHVAVLDSTIHEVRAHGNRTPIHELLPKLADESTTWIDDLDWWSHR